MLSCRKHHSQRGGGHTEIKETLNQQGRIGRHSQSRIALTQAVSDGRRECEIGSGMNGDDGTCHSMEGTLLSMSKNGRIYENHTIMRMEYEHRFNVQIDMFALLELFDRDEILLSRLV
jgi:hypothetical protein